MTLPVFNPDEGADASPTKHLRSFFSYYGAKWQMAPLYPPPRYDHVVEPFAGSACYSLLYPDRRVTLVDSYPVICGVWRYLVAASEAEILALPDLQPGQSVADLAHLPQEARWLIGFWLAKARMVPSQTASPWMAKYTSSSFWGPRLRRRIAAQQSRIRHWRVVEGDYTVADLGPATYFVDSPYQRGGKHYARKFTDFAGLAAWVRCLPGQVTVCEAEGADWLPFRPLASVRAFSRVPGVDLSHEVVWTNE